MQVIIKKASIIEIRERIKRDNNGQDIGLIRTAIIRTWGAEFNVVCDSLFKIDESNEIGKLGTVVLDCDVNTNLKQKYGKVMYDVSSGFIPNKLLGFKIDQEQVLDFD